MNKEVSTVIDPALCTACGLCIQVCPAGTLSMEDGKAAVTGEQSLGCGHCEAVCPVGAVRVEALEDRFHFKTFKTNESWLPHGAFDTAALAQLMRSRRSCRNYSDKEIDGDMLKDLVRIGTTAPSGTNCQNWTFTVLASRSEVKRVGDRIALYFKQLNRMAEKPFYRLWSKLFGNGVLGSYYRSYYQMMAEGIAEWEKDGTDLLFHGASAVIMVGASPGASCPMEDALLATQNILLAAHAMGLGTCLIGFAVAALMRDRKINQMLKIPAGEEIYSVIALGYPDEEYQKVAGRKPVSPRYPFQAG